MSTAAEASSMHAPAVEAQAETITDSAALAGNSSATRFVSNWTHDTNATSHNLIFPHNLGVIPSALLIQFSLDLKTVYPLIWRWNTNDAGNPVSVWMDASAITISIYSYSSVPLHGWWDGNTGLWTKSNSGYWRVIASA